jgi:hypothetical protein
MTSRERHNQHRTPPRIPHRGVRMEWTDLGCILAQNCKNAPSPIFNRNVEKGKSQGSQRQLSPKSRGTRVDNRQNWPRREGFSRGGRDAERTPHNKADKGQFDRTRWVEQRLLADKGGKIKVLGEERGLFSTSAVCLGFWLVPDHFDDNLTRMNTPYPRHGSRG